MGSVYASTEITVTAPLVSLSVSPSSPTVALNSSQELQLTATGNYSDGSSKNLTGNVTWSSSNSSVATVIVTPTVPGVAPPGPVESVPVATLTAGTANITATFGSISGTTPVTVVTPSVPIPPNITSVSPNGGQAGTQVTITGTGFGPTQGSGTVSLGTTLGTVLTWSDTQVIAAVNTGSSSGAAQVHQNNLASNAVPFTVNTATITGISPNAGLPGTQVTISGSGFGSTQGTGIVWLGTAAAIVDSWSDGQVVATVAAASNTGNAQILQNGVWSNSVPFSIDSLQITSISPNSGSGGTVVTVTRGGFGDTQGNGNVWIGNTFGIVMGWSDAQIVASVASSAVSGVVKVEQNGVWSNALAFSVPSSFGGGTQFSVVPGVISMVVGDTRSIQAVDTNGQEVTGLNWTSSNMAVVTLSTDDPPIVTAVGAGTATINTGSASADVTVYPGPILPIGTKIWSNSGDGSGVSKIIPAVPSPSGGADVFALQNSGVVMALRSDGTQMWSANVGIGATLMPDFQGGLIVPGQRLDGKTGQPTAQFDGNAVLVHTDGTIFTDGAVGGIDAATGNQKFPPIQTEQGTIWEYDAGNCGEYNPRITQGPYSPFQPGPGIGQPIIAGDGYAYFPYMWTNLRGVVNVCDNGEPASTVHTDFHLRILRVGTDGSSQEIVIGDWAMDSAGVGGVGTTSGGIPNVAGSLITNADQGALYSWTACFEDATLTCAPQYKLTTISKDGTPTTVQTTLGMSIAPVSPGNISPIRPVLQRADNSYVGTMFMFNGSSYVNPMVAFTASGQQLWSQPNYTPQIATAGGGVIATNSNSGQTATFDGGGNQTGQLASLPIQSWKGSYQQGSVDSFYALLATLEKSYSAAPGGNPTGNGTSLVVHTLGLFWCGSGVAEQGPCNQKGEPTGTDVDFSYALQPGSDGTIANKQSFANNPTWIGVVENAALSAFQKAYANLPVTVRFATIGPKLFGGTQWDQDYVAKVVGDWPPGAHGASDLAGYYDGLNPDGKAVSRIFYWDNLDSAEQALGHSEAGNGCGNNDGYWYRFELAAWPPPDTNKFLRLLTALGTGIGNAAVHESGHWLEHTPVNGLGLPGMHCGAGNKQAGGNSRTGFDCENENNFVYEFYNDNGYPQCPGNPSSVGAQFRYLDESIPGSSPIGWQPEDRCWIARWLNVKDNTCH